MALPTNMFTISSSFAQEFNRNKPKLAQSPPHDKHLNPRHNHVFPRVSNLFKSIGDFLNNVFSRPLPPYLDAKQVLSGNFSPVGELTPTACAVAGGSLPSCLDGAYIRNGPNPQFPPARGPYHLFDGDGMLHMIRISGGGAVFCSRYVKTYKHRTEQKFGNPFFPSVFSSFNGLASSIATGVMVLIRILTGEFNPLANGIGTANTAVAVIGQKLFALAEYDLPYEIKITDGGDIITVGRRNFFKSSFGFMTMTAHPKTDLVTMETFAFRYDVFQPRLTFLRIDPDGGTASELPIFSMNITSMAHDFAVTENFIVFAETQFVLDWMEITRGRPPIRVDADKKVRLGVVRRYTEDDRDLMWIEAEEGFNILHFVNAWEENDGGGDAIVMVATVVSEKLMLSEIKMEKIVVNLVDRTLKRQTLSNKILELAVINSSYAGKRNRYVYAAILAEPQLAVGVVKLDLLSPTDSSDHVVASHIYGPGCSGGEPFFVAREPENPAAEEDDGYLVMYLHNVSSEESMFVVMDAKSPTLETIATVKLPSRVPSGFHGLFLSESEIRNLR